MMQMSILRNTHLLGHFAVAKAKFSKQNYYFPTMKEHVLKINIVNKYVMSIINRKKGK